jgi:hypothetical protein
MNLVSTFGFGTRKDQIARLRERDGDTCQICHEPIDFAIRGKNNNNRWRVSIDHIIPECHNGSDEDENLRLTHVFCNNKRMTNDCPRCETDLAYLCRFGNPEWTTTCRCGKRINDDLVIEENGQRFCSAVCAKNAAEYQRLKAEHPLLNLSEQETENLRNKIVKL